jgi:hypothetical protein
VCPLFQFSYVAGWLVTVAKQITKYKLHLVGVQEVNRSRRPRCLRRELSSPAPTLRSWGRIPLEAWMSVCVYSVLVLCEGSGLATG